MCIFFSLPVPHRSGLPSPKSSSSWNCSCVKLFPGGCRRRRRRCFCPKFTTLWPLTQSHSNLLIAAIWTREGKHKGSCSAYNFIKAFFTAQSCAIFLLKPHYLQGEFIQWSTHLRFQPKRVSFFFFLRKRKFKYMADSTQARHAKPKRLPAPKTRLREKDNPPRMKSSQISGQKHSQRGNKPQSYPHLVEIPSDWHPWGFLPSKTQMNARTPPRDANTVSAALFAGKQARQARKPRRTGQEARRSREQQLQAGERLSRAVSETLHPHLTSLTPSDPLPSQTPAPLSPKTARLPPPPPTQPRDDRAQRGGKQSALGSPSHSPRASCCGFSRSLAWLYH